MSLQNSVFKSRSGDFYKVVLPRENSAQLSLKSESFWNEGSAQQFISNLFVPNGYWRDILHQYSTLPCPSSLNCYEIEKQVSTLMMQGQINFYPIDMPDASERPPENRVIKSSEDILYRFVPVSSLLINKDAKTEQFKNIKEIKLLLSKLNPDDKKLLTIANDLKITLPNTASVNKEEITDSISEAILSGQVVIIADKISSPPINKNKFIDTHNMIGNKKADLGPKKEETNIHWFSMQLVNDKSELYKSESFSISLSDKTKEIIDESSPNYRKEQLPSGKCKIQFTSFYDKIEQWLNKRSQ